MEKIKIKTSEAIPGMVAAEDIYTFNNQLIIPHDTCITDRMITRLKFYSITDFYIRKAVAPTVQKMNPQMIYSDAVRMTSEFKQFDTKLHSAVSDFKNSYRNIVESQAPLDADELAGGIHSILSTGRNGLHLFDMIHCTREHDDQTYYHSVNVAILCSIIGHWLHYSKSDIDVLILCGLLHDIGKTQIPINILNKPTKLTDAEYSTVKMHPIQGFNMLQDKNIDNRIKRSVLMHHERCDGSGYPSRLKKNQIEPFAKIVAIADVYDAMTSARVYRGPLCPFEVINLFETEGLLKYDPRFILIFLEGVVQSYLNNEVLLSNGMNGEVVMINKLSLSKPIVKVGSNFIDLSTEPDIFIEAII